MDSKESKPIVPLSLLILIFLAISAGASVVGHMYYMNQKRYVLNSGIQALSTITDMKVRQIMQWRTERIGDGTNCSHNASFLRQFSGFIDNYGDMTLRRDLLIDLKALTDNYDYNNAFIVDRNLNVRLCYPNRDSLSDDYSRAWLLKIMKKGDVILTDLHRTGIGNSGRIDLLVPFIGFGTRDTSLKGMLVLRIDPSRVLFPLINAWPVKSASSESFIIRREGDQVIYLSDLKFADSVAFNYKRSMTEGQLVTAMAFQGLKETTDALDYRGVHVIASMKKVPETSWYIVAKTDREEIFSKLHSQITLVKMFIILLILSFLSLTGLIWWRQRMSYYRQKYEAELERLALVRHYDYILKYANDLIILLDKDLKVIEANDRLLQVYQLTRDEITGKNIRKVISHSNLVHVVENKKVLDAQGYSTFEATFTKKDGTTFPVEISARKVEIEGVTYYQSIMRDITERKNAEVTLKESEEKFRKIFEESPIGAAMTGKDLGIVMANSEFCNMFGYSEDDLQGKTFRNFTHPDHIAGDELSILRLVAREIPVYHTEKRYIRSDGAIIWGSTTISIIRNNYGEVQFFLAMVEDITQRKKAEAELIAAKEKAEESDRLKTAFLHNVSHEIRTPMNAILGFTSLLDEPGTKEDERHQFIDIIFQSGNHLLSIINDIVDLAGIESGQVKLKKTTFNLNAALKSLRDQFNYKGKESRIELILSAPSGKQEPEIITDRTKLVQILSNLINNAFKFTLEGKITFGYSMKDGFIEFFVKDTGIGISPEYHSKIFDRFYQVDSSLSRQHYGTGLGLSISKAYVELLGGKIWLKSSPGEGTEIYFTILCLSKPGPEKQ
ncbi:MAG: PAS domain S-box protein [Bacteroidales bacterium]|jgi:hypothetical protein